MRLWTRSSSFYPRRFLTLALLSSNSSSYWTSSNQFLFVSAFGRSSSSVVYWNKKAWSSSTSTAIMVKKASRGKKEAEEESGVEFVNDGPSWFRRERGRLLNKGSIPESGECVVYWMIRDVRCVDNWALLYARHLAAKQNQPLMVLYVLPPPPPHTETVDEDVPPLQTSQKMTLRHGDFLLGGLQCLNKELNDLNIPLHVLQPDNVEVGQVVQDFIDNHKASTCVVDYSPLRQVVGWLEQLTSVKIPVVQVDAHNIVPAWYASNKREVGARTLRPKLHKLLPDFLTDYPTLSPNTIKLPLPNTNWEECRSFLQLDTSVPSINDICPPGNEAAMKQFTSFLNKGLSKFDTLRNDPNYRHVCSNMSPYINHGHVSFQRLAWEVKHSKKHPLGTAAFLEEGIVRRELSDNYVHYTPNDYDTLQGAAQWAQDSLELHSTDEREYLYTTQQLQRGETHDDLWNASQHQLVQEGTLHGFLRMYWAKKILEWTESPHVALRTAQYFNDRYALDGNDPNGFVGVGWSIMGIHDMGWKERPVFGKIRFMNYKGCQRKFKVANFVNQYPQAKKNAATLTSTKPTTSTKKRKR